MKFEVDHITPRSRGGSNSQDNLALACPICNPFKSDFQTGIAKAAADTEFLFNPRSDLWSDHFTVDIETAEIIGVTLKGQATIVRLQMNRPHQVNARYRWLLLELFP